MTQEIQKKNGSRQSAHITRFQHKTSPTTKGIHKSE